MSVYKAIQWSVVCFKPCSNSLRLLSTLRSVAAYKEVRLQREEKASNPNSMLPSYLIARNFSQSLCLNQRPDELVAEPPAEQNKRVSLNKLNPFKWVKNIYAQKGEELLLSKYLYEACSENVDFDAFYKSFSMPDTFHSWFIVLQLHVWFLLVRLKQEGKRGREIYQNLVKLMWMDVEERMKLMNVNDSSVRNNSLKELVEEFHGCIVAFDEGILSHDRILAAALWRNFVDDKRRMNASSLGHLVGYVREQILHLDGIEFNGLLQGKPFEWIKFVEEKTETPTYVDDVG